jgi:hypothetical protein
MKGTKIYNRSPDALLIALQLCHACGEYTPIIDDVFPLIAVTLTAPTAEASPFDALCHLLKAMCVIQEHPPLFVFAFYKAVPLIKPPFPLFPHVTVLSYNYVHKDIHIIIYFNFLL